MSYTITGDCFNCGACEPECPRTAIYEGGAEWVDGQGNHHGALCNDHYYIVPEKCNECDGIAEVPYCLPQCAVNCIIK